jgi:hypothetical protein
MHGVWPGGLVASHGEPVDGIIMIHGMERVISRRRGNSLFIELSKRR